MIWILALILVVSIIWFYKREAKKRAEWKMEYLYLKRHEKDEPLVSPIVDDGMDLNSELVSTPHKRPETQDIPSQFATSSVNINMAFNDELLTTPEPEKNTDVKWKNLQHKVQDSLRETSSVSLQRGQDWFSSVKQAAKHQKSEKVVTAETTTSVPPVQAVVLAETGMDDEPDAKDLAAYPLWMPTETEIPNAIATLPDANKQNTTIHSAAQRTNVIEVSDLNEMVFKAMQMDESGLQYDDAFMSHEENWDRWSDETEDNMRQEITLEEINARRERLRERQRIQPHVFEPEFIPHQNIIEENDVAHVIRAIKEEAVPVVLAAETIEAEAVEHVIQSIKAEQKIAPAPELEVIEFIPKEAEKQAITMPLQTIGLDEIQQHQNILQARAQKVAKVSVDKSRLETIHLPEHTYVPKLKVEKMTHEVIEFPNAVVKKVTPKSAPSLQTIVLTEEGLQTVQANETMTSSVRPGRAASDTALLNAMVEGRTQAMIADDDIRANLLRQRMARRRGANDVAVAGLLSNSVIAEEEVLANLAKTDSPVNRQQRPVKPRPLVRDSVIPPTSRVGGEHGFKVKPQASTSVPVQPISTRFTPFSHPELQTSETDANAPTEPVSVNVVPVMPSQAAASESVLVPVLQAAIDTTLPVEASAQFASANVLMPVVAPVHTVTEKAVAALANRVDVANQVVRSSKTVVDSAVLPSKKTVAPIVWDDANELLPSVGLLQPAIDDSALRPNEEILLNNGIIIEEKLAEFKVNVTVTDAYAGPVITRYEIEPATGVRGSQVVNLEKDLARSLGFASIRVVETIPGKTCMGLELPNPKRQIIRLSSVLQSVAFQESKSKLTLVLGQDISGNPVVTDLAKAPHLLVAGTTGSGKSVGVNAMILSLLYKATPEEVRMIMIDPKMLELSVYEGIPHLLAPVVTDMKLAANALNWCVNEMEKRYRLMSHLGVRNVAGYNQKIVEAQAKGQRLANPFSLTPETPELLEKLPFIVVVVDEFADLMMTAGKKIEELIARLAQKARAAGIHLILATQRPSVDVITGLIKANIPTRIAFQVSSKIDSRTILDQMGAENLLGQGDMLFLPPGTGYPRRVHGAFVADDEVHNVVEYLKQFGEPDYVEDLLTHGGIDDSSGADGGNARAAEEDPLYDQAVHFVATSGKTSISAVQRQLRIGYNRAARLVEQMEAAGVLSAPEHNGNRTLLIPQQAQ